MEVIKTLPDNSIDSVVTDPPYALVSIVNRFGKTSIEDKNQTGERCAARIDPYARSARGFMGKAWDNGETAFNQEFWFEVMRVLKPGGHMAVFGGTRTYHRLVCAIEDAGFEIRDAIMWHYGVGFPKSHNISKKIDKDAGSERKVIKENYTCKRIKPGATIMNEGAWGKQEISYTATETAPATEDAELWNGWGTALKPATEIICLARKPLSEKTVVKNVLRWGTGAINVDACRVATTDKPHSYPNGPGGCKSSEFHFQARATTPAEGSPLGRWPANLCLSWSDDEYLLRNDINKEDKKELFNWLNENT